MQAVLGRGKVRRALLSFAGVGISPLNDLYVLVF